MLFIPEDEVVAWGHIITPTVIPGKAGNPVWQLIPVFETVAKGPEKKGTTKHTKSTKKSFSFPLCSSCPSWFEAFMLFVTTSKAGIHFSPHIPDLNGDKKIKKTPIKR